MRTRCNGQAPCSRCIELEYVCQYNREKKRRGKVPRHIQKQREEAAHTGQTSPQDGNHTPMHNSVHFEGADAIPELDDEIWSPTGPPPMHHQNFPHTKMDMPHPQSPSWQGLNPNSGFDGQQVNQIMIDPVLLGEMNPYHQNRGPPPMPHHHNEELMFSMNELHLVPETNTPVGVPPGFAQMHYPMPFNTVRQSSPHSYNSADTGSPHSGVSIASSRQGAAQAAPCRYPVLNPLLPHLTSILTVPMACDLLEFYFQSSSSIFMEPVSPYILGTVFRKRSFLRQHKPRKCSPALLASMLWIAAQTCEAAYLTSSPSARTVLCQKLWKLSIDLLKPLVHSATGNPQGPNTMNNPVVNEAFGVSRVMGRFDSGISDSPVGDLDDIATYMNLGVVTSASEFKAASLRWWNAAWSLARELKLGRELPQETTEREQNTNEAGDVDMNMSDGVNSGVQLPATSPSLALIEEMREERRRLWWLLYMIDRHLSLCYNKALFLLDNECEDLFHPVPDTVWQAGEFYTGSSTQKRKGLAFQCTGHDVFGFFLPLMTILGDIIDLNHARNHPRFGQRHSASWDLHEKEITLQLEKYAYSLQEFKAQQGGESTSGEAGNSSNMDPVRGEWIHQTRKVVAYGTHIMHVLHILLHGKWDPVSLLEDDNLWICSPSFLAATSNAVSAAHAVEEILELDPDLSFMPYFLGIYLLQGSLILLLLADKLQVDTNDGVIKACETLVRAHEAAVVTLNTEYQRNFRKVMISTLSQIKGVGHSREMSQAKRRELLSMYRWTSLSNGLAI